MTFLLQETRRYLDYDICSDYGIRMSDAEHDYRRQIVQRMEKYDAELSDIKRARGGGGGACVSASKKAYLTKELSVSRMRCNHFFACEYLRLGKALLRDGDSPATDAMPASAATSVVAAGCVDWSNMQAKLFPETMDDSSGNPDFIDASSEEVCTASVNMYKRV